jgi:hypothetical protein
LQRTPITKIGGGKFIGSSPRENEIWNQCTRLIANCIIYYNAVLIDQVLQKLEAEGKEALFLEYIKNVSPIAWIHINLTGKYEFTNEKTDINIEEIARQLKEALNDKDLFKKDRS